MVLKKIEYIKYIKYNINLNIYQLLHIYNFIYIHNENVVK